jgi:hypothetical protein
MIRFQGFNAFYPLRGRISVRFLMLILPHIELSISLPGLPPDFCLAFYLKKGKNAIRRIDS